MREVSYDHGVKINYTILSLFSHFNEKFSIDSHHLNLAMVLGSIKIMFTPSRDI